MAETPTYFHSDTDRPAGEAQIKHALKPIAMTYPNLLPMELAAMTAALGELPLWAIERAVKRVVTGTDGRSIDDAAFPPKAPQIAIIARAIVGFEMARRKNEEGKRLEKPAPAKAITHEEPLTPEQQRQVDAIRASLPNRLRRMSA
jgi:hypothetical protein